MVTEGDVKSAISMSSAAVRDFMVAYLWIEFKQKLFFGLKNVSLGRVTSGLKGSLYKLSYKSNGAVIILQSFEREAIKD